MSGFGELLIGVGNSSSLPTFSSLSHFITSPLIDLSSTNMSVVTLGDNAPQLTSDKLTDLANKADLKIKNDHIADFGRLLGALDQNVKKVLDADDYIPTPDLQKYPRTDIVDLTNNPEDSDKGGWATKCTAKSISPTSGLLKGKTIALKDNVALAGIRCTNGTAALNWTPELDATIATRIMDAGGIITGKATCENACMEGVSDTSITGPVHNPYANGYSCGGSSSGSARLVATGSVDMAIGGDQGGSIRIPSAMCGVVGLKPTWGLVPYTGIVSLEATIDHTGPMTKTVKDAALLLEVIAGPDGIDDRQPPLWPEEMGKYTTQLDNFLTSTSDPSKPLAGMKLGVLEEGFTIPNMDPNISALCSKAVDKLASLGADIQKVSIPSHSDAAILWMLSMPIAGGRQGLLSDMSGRKQLYMTDRIKLSGRKLSQEAFDNLSPGGQNLYLRYLYLEAKYGIELHAKCANLLRKLSVRRLSIPTRPNQHSHAPANHHRSPTRTPTTTPSNLSTPSSCPPSPPPPANSSPTPPRTAPSNASPATSVSSATPPLSTVPATPPSPSPSASSLRKTTPASSCPWDCRSWGRSGGSWTACGSGRCGRAVGTGSRIVLPERCHNGMVVDGWARVKFGSNLYWVGVFSRSRFPSENYVRANLAQVTAQPSPAQPSTAQFQLSPCVKTRPDHIPV